MRYIICFLIVALACTNVLAQSPVTFGPKLGMHFNKMRTVGDGYSIQQEQIVSAAVGAFLRIKVKRCYIQGEGYWTTKGANFLFSDNTTGEVLEGKVRLRTFDVPVLFGLHLIRVKSDVFNLRVHGGPVFSSVINEKVNDFQFIDENNYLFNKSDVGFQLGGGIDILRFSIDVRYETGLSNFSENFNQRSKLYLVSVAYKIL